MPIVIYRSLSIIGFPKHRVGTDGSVWSCLRGYWKELATVSLRPQCGRLGYKKVKLAQYGTTESWWLVHRLILTVFVGPCPKGMECCHNDGDTRNNRLSNLRWDTRKANYLDRIKHGTHNVGKRINSGESNGMAKLTYKIVEQIRKDYESGLGGYKILGRKYLVNTFTIRDIVKRRHWN